MDTVKLNILVNHLQITAITYSFKIGYPRIVMKVMKIMLSIFTFGFMDYAGLECFARKTVSFGWIWGVQVSYPLILIIPFIFRSLFKYKESSLTEEQRKRYSSTTLLISVFVHT